jgi:glutaredoxin 3
MSLFKENVVYRPMLYPWADEIWQRSEKMHWLKDEIPLGDDVAAWKNGKLTPQEKEYITQNLRMFTQSDVNVGNLYYRIFIPQFSNNEVVRMLGGSANREGTHQDSYSNLNDTLGLPEGDYSAFLEYKEMADKHEFMIKMDVSTRQGLGLALAKGMFNEGVSLFASFVMLLNFQRRGLMTGMCKIVEWSIRDENLHCEGIAKVFQALCAECPEIVNDKFKKDIYSMARMVVELEESFINLAYAQFEIEGLPKAEVKQYMRYMTDRRLNQLGLKENFGIEKNPLPWLDWIVSGAQHTNFFEQKVSDYQVAGLQGSDWSYEVERSFVIYTKNDCPWCTKAKNLIVAKGYEFVEISLADYDKRQNFYIENGFSEGMRTMPKIYENDELIGGYTDLEQYLDLD